jgi:hypothetical protein
LSSTSLVWIRFLASKSQFEIPLTQIITPLAFHSGWANAMSAVAVAKDVFIHAKSMAIRLAPASPPLLPLDDATEAQRAARDKQQVGSVAPGIVQYMTGVLFPRLVAAAGPCVAGSEFGHGQRADCFRPFRADS